MTRIREIAENMKKRAVRLGALETLLEQAHELITYAVPGADCKSEEWQEDSAKWFTYYNALKEDEKDVS